MCFTIEQLDRACGFLLLSEANVFVYFCKRCPNEYKTGAELEMHILFEHDDDTDEKKPFESVFVSDSVDTETIEFTDYVKTEPTQKPNELIPAELVGTKETKTEHKTVNTTKNSNQISSNDTSVVDEPAQHSSNNISDDNSVCDTTNETHVNNSKCRKKPLKPRATVKRKRRNNGKQTKPKDETREIFYCDMCPEVTLSTFTILKAHMKRHIKNTLRKPCPLCPIRPRNFEKHMRYAHIEAKPYKCDFCDATFKHNVGRVIHMRMHTGERPFLCATCGTSFKCQSARKAHNIRAHGGTKPHPCNECGRRFLTPSLLQEHIYSFHSTERVYSCEICGNNYSTRKYLRKHRQSHGEKIHPCKHCDKKFKTTETRRWHERTVHKAI